MGSITVAAWIAHIAFWVLLMRTWFELGRRHVTVFVILWIGGYLALRVNGGLFFMPYVAILDVVMLLLLTRAGID